MDFIIKKVTSEDQSFIRNNLHLSLPQNANVNTLESIKLINDDILSLSDFYFVTKKKKKFLVMFL
ncbi:hypothetical protein GLW08_02765 [Pontibacillus yanchengensis]|uniref:Uncharacterized protein n=2 Tax=Pontibacillus yanchengensis TaxID=462910 RepID=A0ACC7VBF3_9BACI|nr:hypothetical protein [Pontibacillus yanchengensis]MYL34758.1 hypothetical protein [Pontibacillus yanchengensis]MYL52256.1 hypothetical protein [Pontibacillus yanchengensis]